MSIKIDSITKKFGNSTALNKISVNIEDKEFIAILGPSGCGKTTLLRLIGGFIKPCEGTIMHGEKLYSSKDYLLPVEKRNLGMVFQSFALWPHMNVKEHVMFPLDSSKHRNMSNAEKDKLVNKTLKMTGLEKLSNRFPGELSGGQKQRVALARAIVGKPSMLLMDEPLSALDAELKIEIRKEIQNIHKVTSTTIVYVTHDQSEALAMADRIIVMRDGNIEQIGTPNEIYLNPQNEFVATFVSKCNIIKGKWEKDSFKVKGTNIVYDGKGIADYFKRNNIYPVRPEQFEISNDKNGIKSKIVNKQYQGREIHYTIDCEGKLITVYDSNLKKYDINENVSLIKN
ncbi:ABC transporter ATP-binding protein [Clostridium sp. AWRP]|uniref:ABC transporter ATP-binding protein n=1 Tax=Clostridium sp. AWRP TaxID=2212991 RepID=UPI000FDABEAC|nr:ABC transporter ATP-binding protein [Clostridium sp. AWRP]AZV57537.1 ABC transporter ATP-binding protein [Clostridium sp. AWRP]